MEDPIVRMDDMNGVPRHDETETPKLVYGTYNL